jgi:hypothetical protein
MLPSVVYLYPGNTEIVRITELQDQLSGQFLQNANVFATLFDRRGNQDHVFQNIQLQYVAGTDGTYQGQVSGDFNASLGGGYTLVLNVEQAGIKAKYSIPAIVQLRKQQ